MKQNKRRARKGNNPVEAAKYPESKPTGMPRDSFDFTTHVIQTVNRQTGGLQPDRIPTHKVVMHLSSNANRDPERVRRALDEAVEDGRLESDGESVWIPE